MIVVSLHPNQPGVSQVVDVTVAVGWEDVVLVLSLHPNQPGVAQVVVDVIVGVVWKDVVSVVVVLSLHPNQPGVLQVDVDVVSEVGVVVASVVVV